MWHRRWYVILAVGFALALASAVVMHFPFPSDHTPEGAYLRIAKSIDEGRVRDIFPYLETDAQWACYSVRDARAKALDRVLKSYPEPQRGELVGAYAELARANDGSDVFVAFATRRGWPARLRRDLSGVANVDVAGDRATVLTARGTRYAFRRRENGMWGITLFTAELVAESERAARDLAVVNAAADDYDRARR